MQTLTKILLVLCLCGICAGANDFSGDGNCVALWSFENGAMTTDSIGTNTLTSNGTPTADTGDYKEKAGCVNFDQSGGSDWYSILDSSLDAGFPIKNGGSGTISVCFWLKPTAASGYIFQKSTGSGDYVYFIDFDGGKLRLRIGHTFGLGIEAAPSFGTAFTTGKWYHCAVTHDAATKAYLLRVWDADAADYLDADITGNFANAIGTAETPPLTIGAYAGGAGAYPGRLDELVVFNDVLTTGEIDQIRAGTYGAAAGGDDGAQAIIVLGK